MTDIERAMRAEVAGLLPVPAGGPNWENVAARAGTRSRRRWVVAVALAAALAVATVMATPLGAEIGGTLGDFTSWVRGEPGTPASAEEQQEFQRANERSWTGFARDAQLRRLLEVERSGTTFRLFGFRTGDQLCLRLVASGDVEANATRCAPLHALQTAREPAIVVAGDEPFGASGDPPNEDGYSAEAYSATFGIASDGVRRVMLGADDGRHEALVGDNAFLYVADHPKLGTRVRTISAEAGDGTRMALAFQPAPFGETGLPSARTGTPGGPTAIERYVEGGSIGWLERLEQRGEPWPDSLASLLEGIGIDEPQLARLVRPDPDDSLGVAIVVGRGRLGAPPWWGSGKVERIVCVFSAGEGGGGGGCTPLATAVSDYTPFTIGVSTESGSSQFSVADGLASDDVASMKAFLGNGDEVDVPLRDNAYSVRLARAAFPVRLVAYDADDRVIGMQVLEEDGMTGPAAPKARKSVRELLRVRAEGGSLGILKAGTPVGGRRCWHFGYGHGAVGGGCTPWPPDGAPLQFLILQRTHADWFLWGTVPPVVASVTLSFPGDTVRLDPVDGFVVYAVPHRYRDALAVRAYGEDGKQVDQREFARRR